MIRRQTFCDELRPEHWRQSPANVPAEGRAQGTGARKGDPVTLGDQSTTSDAEAELIQALVGFDGFGWNRLCKKLVNLNAEQSRT